MIDAEFIHHLRQAEADLGLARTAIGLALTRSPAAAGPNLRFMSTCLEMAEGQVRAMRQLAETPVGESDT